MNQYLAQFDPAVAAALTDLVTATLGIGSNRVFITAGGS